MPRPISLAHHNARRLAEARRTRQLPYLRHESRVQVTVGYEPDGTPAQIEDVVVSAQHHDEVEIAQLRADIEEHVIRAALADGLGGECARFQVNPARRIVIGGLVASARVHSLSS